MPGLTCVQADEPEGEHGQCADQQQDFEALSIPATCVSQAEAPAVVLDVAEGFFDLHALGVEALDLPTGMFVVGQ